MRSGSSAVARSSARLAEWCLGKGSGIQPLNTPHATPAGALALDCGTTTRTQSAWEECVGSISAGIAQDTVSLKCLQCVR